MNVSCIVVVVVVGCNRMQEEVDAVMASKSFVDYEDLNKLKYCGQVFRETLRLYPPAPATARENLEELTADGFRIPAHSWIVVCMTSVFSRPYRVVRSSLWYDVLSVCRLSVCNVLYCG